MAKGIRIDFLADVRDFLRGTKDVEQGLEDVGGSLDDVARDGDDAAGKLEKSFKDALDDVKVRGKDAGDDLGKRIKHGASDASEGMADFQANTEANLKETAASFGSVEDALGGLQGLAAEALEGFGPAGVAAGAAMALGIGVVSTKLQDIADKTNEAAEAAAEFALAWRDAADEGERAQLLADGYDQVAGKIGDARHAWEVWQKDAVTNAEAFAASIDAGALSVQDLQRAFTSTDPTERIAAAKEASAQLARQLEATAGAWDNTNVATQIATGTLEEQVGLSQDQIDALKATKKAIDEKAKADTDAQRVLEAYAAASGQTVDAYLAEQEAAKAATESVQSYGSALEGMADPVSRFNTLLEKGGEDANVTIADMIADLETTASRKEKFERNLRTLAAKGGKALVDELRAAGPEAAGRLTSALAQGTGKEVREYARLRAKTVGTKAAEGIGEGITAKTDDLTLSLNRAVQNAAKASGEEFAKNPVKTPVVDLRAEVDANAMLAQLQRDVDTRKLKITVVGRSGGPST